LGGGCWQPKGRLYVKAILYRLHRQGPPDNPRLAVPFIDDIEAHRVLDELDVCVRFHHRPTPLSPNSLRIAAASSGLT
jgi:hypothetical protein